MSKATITYSDLVKALADAARAGPVPVDGLSTYEWSEVWGVGVASARRRITQALAAGLMRVVRTTRTNLIGHDCPTQVFQLVKETKRASKSQRRKCK